jgi:hypothetical protein
MAGGYTHLTLVRSAIREAGRSLSALDEALGPWGRFAYLGGVSPDYPYLGLDADWADLMHKGKTDHMIKHAMPLLHTMRIQDPDGAPWRQQFAWLLGFVSHVIADVTIHPVVNIRVGKYEENKDRHRACEMNQDVWIYKEITGLGLHTSDNMKGEIRSCGTQMDLNDDVESFWGGCLERAYGVTPGDDQIDKWHAFFIKLVDFAEMGRKIPVFGRHMASGATAYPSIDELEPSYIHDLAVPVSDAIIDPIDQQPKDRGQPSSFKDIFTKTRGHILEAWSVMAEDMFADEQSVGTRHVRVFDDWSLDTGIDNATQKLRLWPWDVKLIKP